MPLLEHQGKGINLNNNISLRLYSLYIILYAFWMGLRITGYIVFIPFLALTVIAIINTNYIDQYRSMADEMKKYADANMQTAQYMTSQFKQVEE